MKSFLRLISFYLKTYSLRKMLNYATMYFIRTGGIITYHASDSHEIRIKIPYNWGTKNYLGTISGGILYAAIEPLYMVMLINRLGQDYIVRDKTATIRYLRPARSTLYARLLIDDQEVEAIKTILTKEPQVDRIYYADLVNDKEIIHVSIRKTINISRRL
jgi:acyl-coenzyme A thioesterase PaaI-like protein